ncbi:hypothetical protein LLUC08_1122 [Lactococcus lactis subsp. lactis]|uniref:Uncharacterized protein n=1 Tax=Lactococcus lactis subsp. lactis TaxID=1360 RepID=A0AAC9R5E9_LACLL|nr:hypothetical protein [Lactococcus lactis]ARE13454.1 hypothetical protein LLUC11_1121 [Lactococcus lactis subsp. lactis]ARE15864.1 hypothetical protein LLUC08_1122 [Lactococcus lactis subsp. lactis]
MKYKFTSLSSAEENSINNYTGEKSGEYIIKEFINMKSAVLYVANNSGFVTTDDEKNHLLLEILKK